LSSALPREGSDEDVMRLDNLLSYRISLLAKLLERQLARLLAEQFGLAVAEYRVLGQVVMRPQSTIGAISTRTLVDKAQVSRAVAALEEQKLLSRRLVNNDRRSPVLTATRSGRALVRRIAPLRHAGERELLSLLDDPDAARQCAETLNRLFQMLIESTDEGAEPTVTQRREAIRRRRSEGGTG
jgi:DNA-binding MarR family transcriptional regulator